MALSPKGVMRVVWERSRCKANGSTQVDRIPFLSVARSLGDFWSFNPRTEKYTISPEPDVSAIPLDLSVQKFVVIASDGLWNVMSPNEVVSFIDEYQSHDECHKPKDVVGALIREALERWDSKRLQADNIAILIAFLSEEDPSNCHDSSIEGTRAATPLKTVAGPSSSDSNPSSIDSSCSRTGLSPTPPVPSLSNGSSSSLETGMFSQPERSDMIGSKRAANVLDTMETKTKLKKRKHKKHRRHGLERELARYMTPSVQI